MKWAKIVEDPESAKKKETWVDKACYRYISQSELEEEFGVWAHYRFAGFKMAARAKKDYEIFCGGYLLFYDEKVRSGTIDHAVYFKWEKKDKHAADNPKVAEAYESVTFFLHPRPRTKVHDNLTLASSESQAGSNKAHQEMFMAPPPGFDDLSIDPPPPPPPPPPSMDDLDSE